MPKERKGFGERERFGRVKREKKEMLVGKEGSQMFCTQ